MAQTSAEFDQPEPCGIIIQTGRGRSARLPFWAYLWSEDADSRACAVPREGRILESPSFRDELSDACRASP